MQMSKDAINKKKKKKRNKEKKNVAGQINYNHKNQTSFKKELSASRQTKLLGTK